jgi:large subunit ribosomal protein L24
MAKIRKGDTVLVIAGKDKGIRGTVLNVLREDNKILVEGVHRVKRHVKAGTTARGAVTGGILVQELPIHISNVKLVNDDKPAKAAKAAKKTAAVDAEKPATDEKPAKAEKAAKEEKPAKKATAKKATAKKATAAKADKPAKEEKPAKKASSKKAAAPKATDTSKEA